MEHRSGTSKVKRFRTSFRNVIYDVMKSRGWEETSSETDWDIQWAERDIVYEVFDKVSLDHHQRINHFRNGRELCRKDLLVKNLKRRRRSLEKAGRSREASQFNFFPVTFVLPREYAMFVEEFKKRGGTWIMKPIGSAQGKGIFLFSRLSDISAWKWDFKARSEGKNNNQVEAYVVQEYIKNPYLIGGKKFDLRLYVLVTCFSPLTVYLHRNGFARFSHTRYSSDHEDIANNFMHLTNVAVQKYGDNYDRRTGGKLDIRSLKMLLISRFGVDAVDRLFHEIQKIVVQSLVSVQQVMISDKHCFELYGYDILLDDNLRPWLIEVNASPSLSASCKKDADRKRAMLNDVLDAVDIEGKLKGGETQIGGLDLIYKDGFVEINRNHCGYRTSLGAVVIDDNHGEKVPLRERYKYIKARRIKEQDDYEEYIHQYGNGTLNRDGAGRRPYRTTSNGNGTRPIHVNRRPFK